MCLDRRRHAGVSERIAECESSETLLFIFSWREEAEGGALGGEIVRPHHICAENNTFIQQDIYNVTKENPEQLLLDCFQ